MVDAPAAVDCHLLEDRHGDLEDRKLGGRAALLRIGRNTKQDERSHEPLELSGLLARLLDRGPAPRVDPGICRGAPELVFIPS
jgi:hypothetical protein